MHYIWLQHTDALLRHLERGFIVFFYESTHKPYTGSFQNGALNHEPATSCVRPHVQGASTEEGDSGETHSQEIDTMRASGMYSFL